MIKLKKSTYTAGRPKGPWFKWKKDPNFLDAILMYAQRGMEEEVPIILISPLVFGKKMKLFL